MKYKVGDKVKIREDLIVDEYYGSAECIEEEMLDYAGCIAEIESAEEGLGTYNLSCDGWKWNWPEGALLPCQVVESGKTYEDGLNDAWEAARKIVFSANGGGFSADELKSIFGESFPPAVLRDFSPREAIENINT